LEGFEWRLIMYMYMYNEAWSFYWVFWQGRGKNKGNWNLMQKVARKGYLILKIHTCMYIYTKDVMYVVINLVFDCNVQVVVFLLNEWMIIMGLPFQHLCLFYTTTPGLSCRTHKAFWLTSHHMHVSITNKYNYTTVEKVGLGG
jgi:hypothetical protein